jgi:hypothetical protein
LLSLAVVGTGCHRAGQQIEDRFVAPERFEMRAPSEELWRLTTNRRGPRETVVVYRRRGGGAMFRVRARPIGGQEAQESLEILAHAIFVREALAEGGQPEIESMTRIALDEREAIAFIGAWLERPVIWQVSTLVMRSQGFLMTLTYAARPALFGPLSSEFERLLRHFHVRLPGPFDPYVLEDLPMGAPGPSPGNANAPRRKEVRPAFRPKNAPPF